MSASTDLLLEQIRLTEEAIAHAERNGKDASSLKKDLEYLHKKLAVCNKALNEGRQVLKG